MRRKTETASVLLEGKIIELTAKALLLEQQFCRCGTRAAENCGCRKITFWIPKSVVRQSSVTAAEQIGNYTLWEKGAAKLSVPLWFFNQKKSLLNN